MTHKSYNGQVCTEVDTFITLNISTETEKGRGSKYLPPQRVELKTFFVLLEIL